jgi:hypothetical protein
MQADDISGLPYSKAEHRRHLAPLLAKRSEGSIEFKHQNTAQCSKGLGRIGSTDTSQLLISRRLWRTQSSGGFPQIQRS